MIKFENKQNGRYFYILIEKDLLNDLVLRIVYGSRHISRSRIVFCNSRMALDKQINRLSKRRIRHGYCLVT